MLDWYLIGKWIDGLAMDWHWIGSQVDGLALELQLVDTIGNVQRCVRGLDNHPTLRLVVPL